MVLFQHEKSFNFDIVMIQKNLYQLTMMREKHTVLILISSPIQENKIFKNN